MDRERQKRKDRGIDREREGRGAGQSDRKKRTEQDRGIEKKILMGSRAKR